MATFTGLESYRLTGVRVTDRELGYGSYAIVLELEYMRLKCAGKKIHEVLLRQGVTGYTVDRFEKECHLLSQVRHPNICLLYTSPSPRDATLSRMPSSA